MTEDSVIRFQVVIIQLLHASNGSPLLPEAVITAFKVVQNHRSFAGEWQYPKCITFPCCQIQVCSFSVMYAFILVKQGFLCSLTSSRFFPAVLAPQQGMEVKSTKIFYSTCRIKLPFQVGAGYTEHFRALTLQGSKLSAPNQEVPGRLIITCHQIPKVLDTFGYPLKHQSKEGSLVNFMQIILTLNISDFQTANFSLNSANLSIAI